MSKFLTKEGKKKEQKLGFEGQSVETINWFTFFLQFGYEPKFYLVCIK